MILELVAKRGRALVDARLLAIELVRRGQLVLAAGAGELPPGLLGQMVPLGESGRQAPRCAHGAPSDCRNRSTRARFDEHGLGTLGVQAKGGLIVPLVFQNHAYGVLVAIDRAPRRARVQRRRRAAARGLRGERRHGGRHRAVGRDRAPPPAPRRRRGRTPALGARASRRHAAEPQRSARRPLDGQALGQARDARAGGRHGDRSSRGGNHQPARADHRPAPRLARRTRRSGRDPGAVRTRRAPGHRRRREHRSRLRAGSRARSVISRRSRQPCTGSCRRR